MDGAVAIVEMLFGNVRVRRRVGLMLEGFRLVSLCPMNFHFPCVMRYVFGLRVCLFFMFFCRICSLLLRVLMLLFLRLPSGFLVHPFCFLRISFCSVLLCLCLV